MFLLSLWPSSQTISHSLLIGINCISGHFSIQRKWTTRHAVQSYAHLEIFPFTFSKKGVVGLQIPYFWWCLHLVQNSKSLFLHQLIMGTPYENRCKLGDKRQCSRNGDQIYLGHSLMWHTYVFRPDNGFTTFIWWNAHPTLWPGGSDNTQFMMGN